MMIPWNRLAFVLLLLAPWAWSQEIEWRDDYAAALEEARETRKPLLVAFRCVP